MQSNLELLPLKELTSQYCRVRGLVIDQNTSRASNRRWDFVIQNGADNEGIGVLSIRFFLSPTTSRIQQDH